MGAGEEKQPEASLENNISAVSSISAIAEDLQRSVVQSKDSAIRSARSLQEASSSHIRSFQDFVPQAASQFKTHEDAFFRKVKDEFMIAREHPAATIGVALSAALLVMRGPRRFLFRHTLGRFQTEEAIFSKAEKHVKELNLSVDLMKKESKKLLERAALAEKDMKYGYNELMNAGSQIQHLSRSIYKAEAQAADLMEGLREISGRDALKLRAEVASMAMFLKRHRSSLENRAMKVSELGIPL
ncbi:uncharacterized protein LOC111485561 [Cucurbita maxima]|uniref:Uncharacterized protein LOC111485561 n=1 Tax=Cucurbita maxima TaxID=3661 RepID=A0A6J1JCJ8_CUCMA|nr:uncharacterized protein LOC111485561 [Cucurbita maxima]